MSSYIKFLASASRRNFLYEHSFEIMPPSSVTWEVYLFFSSPSNFKLW